MDIKPYNSENLLSVFELWNTTLADVWPIEKDQLEDRISKGNNFAAFDGEKLIGFVNTQHNSEKGQITLIMVNKDKQRQGIGKQLLEHAKEYLKDQGIDEILVGSGAGSYFWPGIPTNLGNAINFFRKNGLNSTEANLDMVGNLQTYLTPETISQSISTLNLQIDFLMDSEKEDLYLFEEQNFPNWVKYFKDSNNDNVLIAKVDNKIVGSVIVLGSEGIVWSKLLEKPGGFGALGVSEEYRGKGIGLAIAAKATELLKERGVKNSFLGWTYLDKWYGKLGYSVWREYEYGNLK